MVFVTTTHTLTPGTPVLVIPARTTAYIIERNGDHAYFVRFDNGRVETYLATEVRA